MAAVVADPDRGPRIEQLRAYAASTVPSFAVPRYDRIVESLPKTPTGKLQKHVLRSDGITPDTVDTSRRPTGPKRTG